MKKITYIALPLLLTTIFLVSNVSAISIFSNYKNKLQGYEDQNDEFMLSLEGLPKISNQENLGFCSAFSTRTLLEYYHCKEEGLDCSNLDNEERLSVLDIASYDHVNADKLEASAFVSRILSNIKKHKNRISSESCAPYEQLRYEYITYDKKRYDKVLGGWTFLKSSFEIYKDENDFMKKSIVDLFSHELPLNVDKLEIKENLSEDNDAGSFLFRTLVPKDCRENNTSKEILDFKRGFAESIVNNKNGKKYILFQIYKLLKNKIPVNINFCSTRYINKKKNTKKCVYHATIIKGIKKVCLENDDTKCEFLIEFHNSYGSKWQREHDNGWQRLTPILNELLEEEPLDWIYNSNKKLASLTLEEKKWLRNKPKDNYKMRFDSVIKEIKNKYNISTVAAKKKGKAVKLQDRDMIKNKSKGGNIDSKIILKSKVKQKGKIETKVIVKTLNKTKVRKDKKTKIYKNIKRHKKDTIMFRLNIIKENIQNWFKKNIDIEKIKKQMTKAIIKVKEQTLQIGKTIVNYFNRVFRHSF